MAYINEMKLNFPSKSFNESFARVAISAFASQLDPTVDELTDIKTAISEAVTNCIVHGYADKIGKVYIFAGLTDKGVLRVRVKDMGVGIPDISKAMEPMYTSVTNGERAGLGFAVMQMFMDKVSVRSNPGKGTTVYMEKKMNSRSNG